MDEPGWYSTSEVARLTGVSYRRLDYWVRMGYVVPAQNPTGSGTQRRWTQENVDRVAQIRDAFNRAIAVLAEAGLDRAARYNLWGVTAKAGIEGTPGL